MRCRALGAVMLAGILTACGSSPPSHYYELSAQPDPAPVAPTGYPMRTVAIGEVKLPGALDRPQIARQIGPNQLEYAESDRWAGPLDDMVRRVLAADLRPLLPAGTALVASDSSAPAGLTVAVEVSRFDADKAGRVTLKPAGRRWTRMARSPAPRARLTIVEPASGSDSAAVAAAMSRAVGAARRQHRRRLGGEGTRQCVDSGGCCRLAKRLMLSTSTFFGLGQRSAPNLVNY